MTHKSQLPKKYVIIENRAGGISVEYHADKCIQGDRYLAYGTTDLGVVLEIVEGTIYGAIVAAERHRSVKAVHEL